MYLVSGCNLTIASFVALQGRGITVVLLTPLNPICLQNHTRWTVTASSYVLVGLAQDLQAASSGSIQCVERGFEFSLSVLLQAQFPRSNSQFFCLSRQVSAVQVLIQRWRGYSLASETAILPHFLRKDMYQTV